MSTIDVLPLSLERTCRVLIVAEDPLVRTGLATMLSREPECDVVGQIGPDSDLASALERSQPDVVLWDAGADPAFPADLGDIVEEAPPMLVLLPEDAARRLQALPIRFLPDRLLLVGLADPTDVLAAEELRSLLGGGVCLNVVDIAALEAAFSRVYGERVLAD